MTPETGRAAARSDTLEAAMGGVAAIVADWFERGRPREHRLRSWLRGRFHKREIPELWSALDRAPGAREAVATIRVRLAGKLART